MLVGEMARRYQTLHNREKLTDNDLLLIRDICRRHQQDLDNPFANTIDMERLGIKPT